MTSPPPDACDVLVVGAGPAGSACALWLARQGHAVVLADQHAFPRDKVCGDGLIPDAHRALQRLGLLREVSARACIAPHLACISALGGQVEVPGRLAVLPRRELDDILRRGAEDAGARFAAGCRFDAPWVEDGRVVGALLRTPDGQHPIRARWTVLATGAVPQALIAAGMCERRAPSGVALRGYIRHPGLAERLRSMQVVWHRRLRMGYGWIFPGPEGVFNIGVGLAHGHARADGPRRRSVADLNLREMLATFGELHPPARELFEGGQWLGPVKGAPLRCSLEGAELARPGLLVTGEAAGSTYAFTGEGIGKAMETGLLAAEALLAGGDDDAAVCERYQATLRALKPRFDLYERANRVNDHPWLADLLIWRARRNPRILQRMSGVLEETHNPGQLVTLRGLARLMLPVRN